MEAFYHAEFLQGYVADYPFAPDGQYGVRIFIMEFSNATWASNAMDNENKGGQKLDSGNYLSTVNSNGLSGIREDGLVGRMRLVVQVDTINKLTGSFGDAPVNGTTFSALVQQLWPVQAAKLPNLPDIPNLDNPAYAEMAFKLSLTAGVGSGALVLLAFIISGAVIVIRDQGMKELVRLMLVPRKPQPVTGSPQVRLQDISKRIRRSGWRSFAVSVFIAVFVSIAEGFAVYHSLNWKLLWLAMAILLFLITLVQSLAASRRQHRYPKLPAGAQGIIYAGNFAASAVVAAGLTLMYGATTPFGMFGIIGLVLGFAFFAMGFAAMTSGRQVSRFFQRLVRTAFRKRIQSDQRGNPINLLRSFQDDDIYVRSSAVTDNFADPIFVEGYANFEEVISASLFKNGPVQAIGIPGTVFQPLGAVRDYVSDDEWEQLVRTRDLDASFIVAVAGRSPSLMTEYSIIRDNGYLSKTLFIFPPLPKTEIDLRAHVLLSALGIDPNSLVPLEGTLPLVVHVVSPYVLCVHCCAARTEQAYSLALDAAVAEALKSGPVISGGGLGPTQDPDQDINRYLVKFDPSKRRRPKTTVSSWLLDQVLTRF